LAAIAVTLNACSPNTFSGSKLIYGLTLSPSGIDPHINASAELGIPLRSVYDTLVFLDPDNGEFVPGLAKSWQISEDGRRYTFDLRSDVEFHDGAPFDADAVQANIDYILNPDHNSQKAAALLGPVDSVEIIDSYTIAINMQEPFAPLLDALSQVYLGMASPSALERWGPAEYQFHQVGTGPYQFVEYVPDDHLLLERYDNYNWGPEIYEREEAAFAQVEFRFYEDVATRAIALESGNVSVLGEIPPLDAIRLSESSQFNLYPIAIPGQPLQYLLNTQNSPTDDVRVRTALIHAVDRQTIVETVFGPTSPISEGPLSKETFGELLTSTLPEFDISQTNRLLKEAGWVKDENGTLRNAAGEIFELKIVAPIWGSNPDVAQLLKVSWENIGAKVTLEIAPGFGPLREIQNSGEYHAIGINFFGTDPDLLRPMFTSSGYFNWSGYTNSDLDRLLEQAAQVSLNRDLREKLYQQSIALINSQALVLPIRDYVNLVVADSELVNLKYSAAGWFPILVDLQPNS
jgi:peptide/nickel transport system substrate-binding protein